jgi:CTP:phosphocholine cytidylyltransferase-like protein
VVTNCVITSNAFRIACKGGTQHLTVSVSVSEHDVNALLETSDYFRAMFEHGTSEVTNRIIHKPGWTIATAESIICLIRESVTRAKTSNAAMELFLASNEILVDVKIFKLESSILFESNSRRNLLGLNAGHLLTQEQAL